ncbi:MAG: O-antigen ligase family protein [bacterium]
MLIYLEKFAFYLFIFCLPFQTRKILYQWGNAFNEWTTAYLYFTDILLLLIFVLWFWRLRKERFLKNIGIGWFKDKIKSPNFWLVVFLLTSFISLSQTKNIQLGFYHWFKLLELFGLFFYLKYNFRQFFNFEQLAKIFIASGLIQSIISIIQYAGQKSIGLKFLAESPLSLEIPGVANFASNGVKIIRSYGTLPHPNVLAVFLFVSIFFLYFLWLRKPHSFIKNCLFLIIFYPLLLALFLTFSRIIIFVFLLSSLIFFALCFRRHKKKVFALLCLLVILCSIFVFLILPEIYSRFSFSLEESSVNLRIFYNQTAFSVISEIPWLGLGIGNFVWGIKQVFIFLPSWAHQPIHNLYLLIAVETGLVGLFLFLFFIWRQIVLLYYSDKSLSRILFFLIIFSFLFIALFDHFFWTLQQGQLVFWLVLGIMAGYSCIKRAP